MPNQIELTKGEIALVDKEFFTAIETTGPWCTMETGKLCYAQRGVVDGGGKQHTVLMHRVIFQFVFPFNTLLIDHINGNGLDNRLANLRTTTHSFNAANSRLRSDNSSGYHGVSWDKSRGMWQANISANKKQFNLGRFETKEEAAHAYNEAALRAFGNHARLNSIIGE